MPTGARVGGRSGSRPGPGPEPGPGNGPGGGPTTTGVGVEAGDSSSAPTGDPSAQSAIISTPGASSVVRGHGPWLPWLPTQRLPESHACAGHPGHRDAKKTRQHACKHRCHCDRNPNLKVATRKQYILWSCTNALVVQGMLSYARMRESGEVDRDQPERQPASAPTKMHAMRKTAYSSLKSTAHRLHRHLGKTTSTFVSRIQGRVHSASLHRAPHLYRCAAPRPRIQRHIHSASLHRA